MRTRLLQSIRAALKVLMEQADILKDDAYANYFYYLVINEYSKSTATYLEETEMMRVNTAWQRKKEKWDREGKEKREGRHPGESPDDFILLSCLLI